MQQHQHHAQELEAIQIDLLALGGAIAARVMRAVRSLDQQDRATAEWLIANDDRISAPCSALKTMILRVISGRRSDDADLPRIMAMLDIASELEGMADNARTIARITVRTAGPLDGRAPDRLADLADHAMGLLATALDTLVVPDVDAARGIDTLAAQVDALEGELRGTLLAQIANSSATIWAVERVQAAYMLERVADRAINVAEQVIFLAGGATAGLAPGRPLRVREMP